MVSSFSNPGFPHVHAHPTRLPAMDARLSAAIDAFEASMRAELRAIRDSVLANLRQAMDSAVALICSNLALLRHNLALGADDGSAPSPMSFDNVEIPDLGHQKPQNRDNNPLRIPSTIHDHSIPPLLSSSLMLPALANSVVNPHSHNSTASTVLLPESKMMTSALQLLHQHSFSDTMKTGPEVVHKLSIISANSNAKFPFLLNDNNSAYLEDFLNEKFGWINWCLVGKFLLKNLCASNLFVEMSKRQSTENLSWSSNLVWSVALGSPCTFAKDMEKPGSQFHMQEICEVFIINAAPPLLVVGIVHYMKTSRGLRSLNTLGVQYLKREVKKRFCKNKCKSKKNTEEVHIWDTILMNFKSDRAVHEELAKYGDLENQVLCKWTYLGHAHMQLNNEKDSREMEACGCDDDLLEDIVLGDLVDGHHAKIGCRVALPSHLTSTTAKELGLVAGIPVETSLIDAHVGGVGLLESVPITDSEPKECYVTKLKGHGAVDTITDKLGTSSTHGISTSEKLFNKRKEIYGVHVDFIPFWNATLVDIGKKKKSSEEAQEVVGKMNDVAASAKQIKEMEQGLTSLIVLGNELFSDLIAQLRDILDGVNEADILPEQFDNAIIRAQIQQLAREIRELTSSGPVTIYNENSSFSGNYASYLVPVAALAAMGYCYMWWIGWSFSDVIYVTRHNMANVVEALIRKVASRSNNFAGNITTNTLKRSECTMNTYLDLVCSLGHLQSNFGALAIDLHAEFYLCFTRNVDFWPIWDPGDASVKAVKLPLQKDGTSIASILFLFIRGMLFKEVVCLAEMEQYCVDDANLSDALPLNFLEATSRDANNHNNSGKHFDGEDSAVWFHFNTIYTVDISPSEYAIMVKTTGHKSLSNVPKLVESLFEKGYDIISGGTENHLVWVNLRDNGIDGSVAEKVLESVHIAAIKNNVPGYVFAVVIVGVLSIESPFSFETIIGVEGLEINKGYFFPQFATNPEKLFVQFENAGVLITDQKISRKFKVGEDCQATGILVMKIMRDNQNIAKGICREIGEFGADEDIHSGSLTGKESMSTLHAPKAHLRQGDGLLFSRVEAKHKQKIVRLHKEDGEVVAMTVDGVNDALTLKLADIRIAMDISGTEVLLELKESVAAFKQVSTVSFLSLEDKANFQGGNIVMNPICN